MRGKTITCCDCPATFERTSNVQKRCKPCGMTARKTSRIGRGTDAPNLSHTRQGYLHR